MNKRKENMYKGAKKRALINTIIGTCICGILFFLGIYYWLTGKEIVYNLEKIKVASLLVFSSVMVFIFFILWSCEKMNQIGKVSEKIVETTIPVNSYVKVVPQGRQLKYVTFFEEISKIGGEYYATLSKDTKEVKIFVKLDKYDEYLFLERVQKEFFIQSYEILETK